MMSEGKGVKKAPEVFKDGNLNAQWITQFDAKDNLMSKIRAYYLPGTKIRPEFKCNASPCRLPVKGSEYMNPITANYEYNPMMYCFTCNQVCHVFCAGISKETINEEAVPWMCKNCRENVKNSQAEAYFKLTGYNMSILERRKHFFRETTIELNETCDSEEEFDTMDIESFKRCASITSSKPQIIVSDSTRLQQEVVAAKSEARRVSERNKQLERSLEEERNQTKIRFDLMMEEILKLKNEVEASKSRDVSNYSTLPAGSETLSMSTFYGGNINSPESESTRWKCQSSGNKQHAQPSVAPSTSYSQPSSNEVNESTLEILSRFTTAQEKIQHEKELTTVRRAMPKISEFYGDAIKWLEFEQDIQRYRDVCKYDDATIKLHVRGALKGDAFEAVKDVFDIFTLKQIMEVLKEAFGDPMTLVRRRSKEVRAVKVPGILYREDAVKIRVVLQGYFAACTYAKTGYINSNELAEIIYEQFNHEDKSRCKEMYIRKNPMKQIVVDLNTIYDYLSERLPILDEKPESLKEKSYKKDDKKGKPLQVMAIGTSTSTTDRFDRNAYKFEIRDRSTAPYLGYEMKELASIPKKCEICSKTGHYSVQCSQFQKMNEEQRLKTATEKKLCRNCLITNTHQAGECNLKVNCGMKTSKQNRCTRKHHCSIHHACEKQSTSAYKRRSHTRNNMSQARKTLNDMQNGNTTVQATIAPQIEATSTQQQQATAAINKANEKTASSNAYLSANSCSQTRRCYHVNQNPNVGVIQLNHVSDNIPRTVKMFKNKFIGPKGYVTAYSVGDSAAEVTLVRNDLRIALGIEGTPEVLSLQWTDNSVKECVAIKFDMELQGILKYSEKLTLKNCYAIDDLELPERTMDMKKMQVLFPYLRGVNFDSYFDEQPVMLIGSPHAYVIESIKGLIEGGEGSPVALETKLGITVYGGSPLESSIRANVNVAARASGNNYRSLVDVTEIQHLTNEELSDLLVYFNSVESLGIRANDTHRTASEQKAIEIMQEEMKVLENGTIEVPLVWDRNDKQIPSLPNNYALAYRRQLAHENKVNKNPIHLAAYNNNVKELMQLGYMREASKEDLNGIWNNIWYLPMNLVVNENKNPPKFRNVYDASAKYEGVSLNDKLLKGPDLLIDVLKPLLRLRMNEIAFTADVQHMFHRMQICLRDQQCQRVLWRESADQPMKTLILNAMAFGPSSSPYTSQYVKNWNAENWSTKYPEASKVIKELVYMDDLIASEPTVEQAVRIATQCIKIFKHINWNLIAFQSNSVEFLKCLPTVNIKKDLFPIIANEAEDYTTKVLGCNWNTTDDCFVYSLNNNIFVKLVTEFKHHPTKRDLASTIARIYDVFGFIAHFLIRGKILQQRAWKAKVNWDDPVPEDIQNDWYIWLRDIENISKLKIPRKYSHLRSLGEAEKLQLHVFCDAGAEAFGCVAYWAIHSKGKIHTCLIMAKAKVTPLRMHTQSEIKAMPRLELMSALLAARLGDKITKYFPDLQFERYFWSDSEVALRWIINPESRLLEYAVGPVEEILDLTKRKEWKYVHTASNPADLCTKFRKFDFSDSKSVWFVGPDFLKDSFESWPQLPQKLMVDEIILASNIYLTKLNYPTHELPAADSNIFNDCIEDLSASTKSRFVKYRRAVARKLKLFFDVFIPLVKNKQFNNKELRHELKEIYENFAYLTPSDYERAEHFLFRKAQMESYPEQYMSMKKGKPVTNKEFLQLSAFMDPQGIIRINARSFLDNNPQKFVPLLPRRNALTHILLMYYHEKYNHVAFESQVAEIRTKCWIPQIRQELRLVKSHCNYCAVKTAMPKNPVMGPLPDERIDSTHLPFETTGVDLFGPITVVHFGRKKKIWVMIFTCALTRFVHLHVVDSLETKKVLEAIIMFIAAHGPVAKFISDNGTNFKGTAKIIKEDYEETKRFFKESRKQFLSDKAVDYQVQWDFIPPSSPWFGSFYERLIKEVKRAMYDILSQKKIDLIELRIAVAETAHRINLRPLTNNPIDAEDQEVLTPHHLAKYRSGWPLLPGLHTGKYQQVDDRIIYRRGRVLADEIMAKFTAYYLPVLTKKVKWLDNDEPLKEEDLVLMIEPNMTRFEWPRGKIVKLFHGKDGIPRVADVLQASGKIKRRPVRKLAKINIQTPPPNAI
jgi:hypothetical protein